jgi:hypothetical protein
MKIAVTMYPLDNLGGIVSNLENQLWGLKELGHEVDFYLLSWQNKFAEPKYDDAELIANFDGWYQGCLYAAHQMKGWNFPFERKIPYKGKDNLIKAKKILSKYDFIIWQIPVPTRQKKNKGNADWIELYKANNTNVVYSHDAHLIGNYPYIYEIKDYLTGIASTNVASYYGNKIGGVQKALIFSSHDLSKMEMRFDYDKRKNGWLSLQTFKGWKHVEDLIRAIPYMHPMKMFLAGGGREQAYMTSVAKCKPEYYCSRKYDPDMSESIERRCYKIWDIALKNGMKWLGWITPKQRDDLLLKCKCLIDPSWNLNFAKKGDHFNRVFTDACIMGTIPIGRNYGISTNAEGQGLIFKAGYNYIMVPHNATPKEFAEIVNDAQNLDRVTWRKIVRRNYVLAENFDRKHCAQQFVNLAMGKKAGFFNDRKVLKATDPKIIEGSSKMMRNFFGVESKIREERIRRFLK